MTENPEILNIQAREACFRRGCLPRDECDECDEDTFLYRVHSRHYMEDKNLIRITGQQMTNDSVLEDHGVRFVRRQAWPHAFAKAVDGPLNLVDEVGIAPDLYYLNGADSVLDSLEMSCRMGRNVALLATRKRRQWRL